MRPGYTKSIRVFRLAIHLWGLGYLLSILPMIGIFSSMPAAERLRPPSIWEALVNAFNTWLGDQMVFPIVLLLLVLFAIGLVRPLGWWFRVVLWVGMTSLFNKAWIASSGGIQLMGILYLWNVFLLNNRDQQTGPSGDRWFGPITFVAFWCIRIQLLITYIASFAFKLQGQAWIDGTALTQIASTGTYPIGSLLNVPLLAMLLTWAALSFQGVFPVLVWWRSTRKPLLIAGTVFHLATGLLLDIPEMAFAFIACYPIWMNAQEAGALISSVQRIRERLGRVMPRSRSTQV